MKHFRKWFRRDEGAAAMEFVLVFPVILTVFFTSLETSTILVRQAMLERAVDITVRDMRLSNAEFLTTTLISNQICNNARIIRDCRDTISLEVNPIERPSYAMPSLQTSCTNRQAQIPNPTQFDPSQTQPNQLMLLRVCVELDPLLPLSAFMVDLNSRMNGTLFLETSTIFVTEPLGEVSQL